MRKAGFLVGLLLLFGCRLFACGGTGLPSYGGEIVYLIDSTNPMKVNITVTMFFANNETLSDDSIVLDWGDSSHSGLQGIYARSIYPDSLAFANAPITPYIYAHVYTGSHIYSSLPTGGYYYAYLTNTYRPAGVVNIDYNDSYLVPYTIQAKIGLDTSLNFLYTPPTLQPVDIFVCAADSFIALQPPLKANGDSVVFQLIAPLFTVNTPVPEFQLPSQTCGGDSDSSFTINSITGDLFWPNVCHDSVYDITTLISTYRNGTLIGAIMRDQLLYTLEGTTAITQVSSTGELNVYPNPATSVLNITLPGGAQQGELTLYDLTGREIYTSRTNNSPIQTMDISALPQGSYLLGFRSNQGSFTQKLIKQ